MSEGFTTLERVNSPGSPTAVTISVAEPAECARSVGHPHPDATAALTTPDADEGDPHRLWGSSGVPPTAHGRSARTVVRTRA